MRYVLITGRGSYVGASVQKHLEEYSDAFSVSSIGTVNGEWEKEDFSRFNVVFHVAGIAHADVGKVTDEVKAKYYSINTDLAISVAQKAKEQGVEQFIFMSSAIVYGDSAPIGKKKEIFRDTPCAPSNCYGDSKLQAEIGLMKLADDKFKVVILRCPMIYGKGGKGNFPVLEKMAKKLPFFPKVVNKRSMLYIKNLAEFVRLMMKNEESGVFWPCNREYSNTSELVRLIANCNGKKRILVPGCSWILKLMSHFTGYVNKAFGNLSYADGLGDYKDEYRLYSLEESIKEIEAP